MVEYERNMAITVVQNVREGCRGGRVRVGVVWGGGKTVSSSAAASALTCNPTSPNRYRRRLWSNNNVD